MKARDVAPAANVAMAPIAWLAMVGTAFAQALPAAAPVTPATIAPASPLAGMLQGLVGLVIVVGLIYVAAWLLKKVGPRARASGMVQIVGGASVGPREKVVVVRFGGETLLLGVAPGQVSLLHTAGILEPTDATAPIEPVATSPRFVDRLRAARGARGVP